MNSIYRTAGPRPVDDRPPNPWGRRVLRIGLILIAMAAVWLGLSAGFASYWNSQFAGAGTAVPAFMTTLLLAGIAWLLLYLRARVFNRNSEAANRGRSRT